MMMHPAFLDHRRESLVRYYVTVVAFAAGIAVLVSAYVEWSILTNVVPSLLGVVAFTLIGLGLQVSEHRLSVGGGHGTISFIVYMGSALVFGPILGAFVTGVSLLGAQVALRKPVLKTAFNVSQHVLAILAGAHLYLLLGGPLPPNSLNDALFPFVGLVLGFFAVNSAAVSGVIALSEGRRFSDVWVKNTGSLVAYHLVASALGLGIAWLYLGVGVWGIAAVVVPILFLRHTILINVQLQETNRELLELMVKSIEARDPYTSGHSQRVSEFARTLARQIGLGFREIEQVATAALLHDVGKIYEEFAPVLRKPGKLSEAERLLMESHVERGTELVRTISNLRGPVERFVRHHHERFDGSGYPDGLVGDDVPIGARIIMIADTADAITTDRPYRKAQPYEKVVHELTEYSGKQFDPRLVSEFVKSTAIRRLIEQRRATGVPLVIERQGSSERRVAR
jgi:putative nucleotidyltransferase with HDIG domain